MAKTSDNPGYWLERANEVRELMKQMPDQVMRDILEEITKGCERIADQVGVASSDPNENCQ
jgi:hypothetical protein